MATYDIKSAPHELDAPTQKNDEAGDVSPVQRSLKGMDYQSAVAALSPQSAPIQMDASSAQMAHANKIHSEAQRGVDSASSGIPHQSTVQELVGPSVDLGGIKSVAGGVGKEVCENTGSNAMATQGTVIFKDSNPSPGTVAHEVKHIKDQQAGTVTGLENGIGKEGDSYEQKADAISDRVNQRQLQLFHWRDQA